MPNDRVTPRNLATALRKLGFVDSARKGSHHLFRHQSTGLIVSLPTGRPFVPIFVVRAIQRSLELHKIIAPSNFQEMLDVKM
jgi:predicted RNA binding protein YcfA (HicA-like mRNA interferase family)